MQIYQRVPLAPPFNFTKVKVGIGGSHYHKPDCSASGFPPGDYAEIKVPKVLLDKLVPIRYLNKIYIACPGCFPPRKR